MLIVKCFVAIVGKIPAVIHPNLSAAFVQSLIPSVCDCMTSNFGRNVMENAESANDEESQHLDTTSQQAVSPSHVT